MNGFCLWYVFVSFLLPHTHTFLENLNTHIAKYVADANAEPQELTFLVISQKEPRSIQDAERLRSSILLQAQIETAEHNIDVSSV